MATTEAAEAVEPVLEAASEAILEGVDDVVETLEVVRNNPTALVLVGLVGLVAGGAGGYFFAKKRLSSFYEELAMSEIAEAREFFKGVNKVGEDGEVLTPQQVLTQRHGQEAAAAVRDYQGLPDEDGLVEVEPGILMDQDDVHIRKMEEALRQKQAEKVVVEEKAESRNVFMDDTFDLNEEVKFRTAERPYVIHHDEYFAAEENFDQERLTYFEVDDTLVNDKDAPIDVDSTIGDESIVRFGHGSKDKNVVYVRNEKERVDYEVVKSSGSYLEEVLGMLPDEPDSLKHSDQRDRRRAFRQGE